jgi:signal transduction histidine kinase
MEYFDGRAASHSHSHRRGEYRFRQWTVVVAAALAIAATTVIVVLRAANPGREPEGWNWWLFAWCAAGFAYGVAGAVCSQVRSGRRLGIQFVAVGFFAVTAAVSVQYGSYASVGDRFAALADAAVWAVPLTATVLVGMVPWNLLPSAWRRRPLAVAARSTAVAAGCAFLITRTLTDWAQPITNPFRPAGGGAWSRTIDTSARWMLAIAGAVGLVALGVQWWRRRQSGGDPLGGWLFFGSCAAWLALVPPMSGIAAAWSPGEATSSPILLLATVPLLIVGVLVELFRDSLSSVEQVSHQAIEWALLAGGIVVMYTVLVAGLGIVVGGDGPTWLLVAATGAIALAVEPARARLRRLVDKLVYGARDDPLSVVQTVVDHVGGITGDDLLPALVASLERELHLDAVAIDIATPNGWQRAASVGPSTPHQREVLLQDRTGIVGRLVVGWTGRATMRARDEHVLVELSGPLALAVGWVRIATELRRSSVAVVSAREEERRRLRRDLHDGLGPALTGVSLGLRSALRQLDRTGTDGPTRTYDLLQRLADEIDGLVAEVKQIARDLRPTALDQLGFVGAIVEFTRKLDGSVEVHVALPPSTIPLPAAVEVAAYRIVTEALTNVVRHAHARECWLTIEAGDAVEIDVVDDGIGFDARAIDGVGLVAMRERASELGGAIRLSARRPRGAHLHVHLPAVLP